MDDETQEIVAFLSDVLVDTDTGCLRGFFVMMIDGLHTGSYFLSVLDILSFGTKVHIRSVDRLSPPEDLIRLQEALQDPRFFLGQKIRVRETGRTLGSCADVQFDTRHFSIFWFFPRRWFLQRQPIAIGEVFEVTEDAIWVEDPLRQKKERAKQEERELVPRVALAEIASSM